MKTNLAKWGNSAAIRIPKAILEELNIDSNNFKNINFFMGERRTLRSFVEYVDNENLKELKN